MVLLDEIGPVAPDELSQQPKLPQLPDGRGQKQQLEFMLHLRLLGCLNLNTLRPLMSLSRRTTTMDHYNFTKKVKMMMMMI